MRKLLMPFLLGAAFCVQAAAPSVSGLSWRQNWPWGPEVEVDYVLEADGTCDLDITFSYCDGIRPVQKTLQLYSIQPGPGHFAWDPVAEGVSGQSVRKFTVAVTPTAATARTYLVIDLQTGAHSYLAAAPASWTDEYKTTKMVFRRIPAGTYVNGDDYATVIRPIYNMPDEAVKHQGTMTPRTVRLTSDCYVGIFPMTGRQYELLSGQSVASTYAKKPLCSGYTYETLRGSPTNGTVCVNWPNTRYAVEPTSVVGRFRALVGNRFRIDLPTEEQWEVAARAGTTTPFPNGGTLKFQPGLDPYTTAAITNMDELTNCVQRLGWCYLNPDYVKGEGFKEVGLLDANGWGLYDVVGNNYEWTLDVGVIAAIPSGVHEDPVGAVNATATTAPAYRTCRSNGYGAGRFLDLMPSHRAWFDPGTAAAGIRFCIHLNSLFHD